jgi:hypothetical protein
VTARVQRRMRAVCTTGLLVVIASTAAYAADVSVTHTRVMDARTDNENGNPDDDNYGVIVDRLNVGASAPGFSVETRIDANGFIFPPTEQFETQIRMERLTARASLLDVQLELGDFYEQIGRGIALSVRKLPEAGVDVSIFGARARYEGDAIAYTAFGGVANTANIDMVSMHAVEDQHDVLAGGLFELFPVAGVRTGTYAVLNQPEETILPDIPDRSLTTGGYLDLPAVVDFASGYVEAMVQQRVLAGTPQVGSAALVEGELRFFDAVLNTELLLLNNFDQKGSRNTALGARFDYNRPPTLERIDQEVINNRDLVGARVRGEYFFFDWNTLLYANGVVRLNEPGEDSELYQTHVFGGFEYTFDDGGSRLNGAIGYRHEQQPTQAVAVKTMSHFDIDYVQALGAGVALHLTSNTQFRTLEQRGYFWGSTFLGLEKAGLGGATFELGYDGFDPSPGVRNVFYAVITNYELSERITLQGIAGNQRGGIKCVSGVCREWPAFSGVRGTMIMRF